MRNRHLLGEERKKDACYVFKPRCTSDVVVIIILHWWSCQPLWSEVKTPGLYYRDLSLRLVCRPSGRGLWACSGKHYLILPGDFLIYVSLFFFPVVVPWSRLLSLQLLLLLAWAGVVLPCQRDTQSQRLRSSEVSSVYRLLLAFTPSPVPFHLLS